MVGLCIIVLAAIIANVLDASLVATVVIVSVTAALVGLFLISGELERWQQTSQAYADAEAEIQQWQSKWDALSSDARQTETAFSHMLDGLVMVSSDGTILLLNDSTRRLMGLSPDANLPGRRFSEVIRVPEIHRALDQAQQNTGHAVTNIEIVDGKTVRPLRVHANRIGDNNDSPMLLMFRDETEAKLVEEIRREFIANVSHELKTPLAAIKGYAETVDLAIKDDPEAASHFMGQIHGQCLRLERLIADMMRLARAQAGSQSMELKRLKIEDTIADALKSYQPIAESKSIHLTVEPSPHGAFVHADPEALLTITNNLIGNAIRYTTDGGHVCVRCCRREDHWALVVQDDGVGIPLKQQERIFERFYRIDKARDSGGTGIGLSIVKHLALALNGRVSVNSRPGKGATFEVQLPALDSEAPADSEAPVDSEAATDVPESRVDGPADRPVKKPAQTEAANA